MRDELKEKLRLSRIHASTFLTPAERRLIVDDTELAEEQLLNDVLHRINQEEWQRPAKAKLMRRAMAAVAKRRRDSAFGRWQRRLNGEISLAPFRLVRRAIVAAAVLIACLVAYTCIHHWQHHSVLHAPSGQTGQIYQLTYSIQLLPAPGRFGNNMLSDERALTAVYQEMRSVYLDWQRRHPELAWESSTGAFISLREVLCTEQAGAEYAQVQIELVLDDEELRPGMLDELAEIFDTIPEVGDCIINCFMRNESEVSPGNEQPVTAGDDSNSSEVPVLSE